MAAPTLRALWNPREKQCIILLQRSTTIKSLLQIHAFMLRNTLETNLPLITKFITALCDLAQNSTPLTLIRYARRVFDHRCREDTFLCNSMIKAYTQNNQFDECVDLYKSLRKNRSFVPDNYTFLFLVKSCARNSVAKGGKQIHDQVIKMGFASDLFVATSMIDMYAKFGDMPSAGQLFVEIPQRSPVSWTAMIVGYARLGNTGAARELFERMPDKDLVAFNAMIDMFVKFGNMSEAQQLFDEMPKRDVVSWTSLISGYCKNGDLDTAGSLFDAMPEKNLFSWNVMIGGYCQNKQPQQAIGLFRKMQSESLFWPDKVTLVSIIPAIADLGALDLANWIHDYVRRKGFVRVTIVCTSLIDMYAKCGNIGKARQVFVDMPEREVASWNAMINGFAVNGHAKEALEVFAEMREGGVLPNDVTMIGVLCACNHGGLVEEGKKWFGEMMKSGIEPSVEHFGIMVDLLGRAGHLEEAEDLVKGMPCEVNGIILSSLLFACACHGDVKRAERVLQRALEVEPWNVGNYVLLRNLYARVGRWGDVERVSRMMRQNGGKKEVGCSVIEVNSRAWEFVAGDSEHPEWGEIYKVLEQLWVHMGDQRERERGWRGVWKDIDEIDRTPHGWK